MAEEISWSRVTQGFRAMIRTKCFIVNAMESHWRVLIGKSDKIEEMDLALV